MSIGDDILVILSSYHGGYKLMSRRMHGYTGPALQKSFQEASEPTLRVVLARLKEKGFVRKDEEEWIITKKGKEFLKKKLKIDLYRKAPKNMPKELIIVFDIPEKQRKKRDWLRRELRRLGFVMLQQSVWLGPILPESFVETLGDLGIIRYSRFFEAKKSSIV